MYKHILVATDGSEIAGRAISHAVALAKAIGAKLSAVTITEPFEAVAIAETMAVLLPTEYNKQCEEHAAKILSQATDAAKAAGLECETMHRQNRWPYEGVIEAAQQAGADLIVIGSHGRRGIEGLLIGSEAVKLLTHSKIPALVVR